MADESQDKTEARTQISCGVGMQQTTVNAREPYRTVKKRMNEARSHFEITIAGYSNGRKMLIQVDNVEFIEEL